MKRAVLRIRIEQVVDDFPGSEVSVIVDNEGKICDVSDIDVGVATFNVYRSNVNGWSYEQGLLDVMIWRKSMAAQKFFRDQWKHEQLGWTNTLFTDDTGVEDPEAVTAVNLKIFRLG